MLHVDFSAIQIPWSYTQNNSGDKNKQFRTTQNHYWWKALSLETEVWLIKNISLHWILVKTSNIKEIHIFLVFQIKYELEFAQFLSLGVFNLGKDIKDDISYITFN